MPTFNVTVGQEVALINFGGFGTRRIAKRRVVKVYKTGHFFLNDSDRKWDKHGRLVGSTHGCECVDLWSQAIEAEIAENTARIERRRRLGEVREFIASREAEGLSSDQLTALESIIAAFKAR